MKSFITYSILILLFLLNIPVQAQDSISQKTNLELRIPSKDKIEKFKKDKDFQYDTVKKQTKLPNWLNKLIDKISNFLLDSLSVVFSREAGLILLVIVISAIIIMIALRWQNISLKTLFGKRKLADNQIDFVSEDINNTNFDQLIDDSLNAKDYRLTIRFLYLKSLKALSDHSIIKWNPNKTNYSYHLEIENQELKNRFLNITRIFDFVWYGEFVLDENSFKDAHVYFHEFNEMIKNER